MKTRLWALLLCIGVLSVPAVRAAEPTASPWAQPEVRSAMEAGLVTPACGEDFTPTMTRLQFADLVVNLVETVTGQPLPAAPSGTFGDCDDLAVRKAYISGFVSGNDLGDFNPSLALTREQLATLLYRAWLYLGLDVPAADLSSYEDAREVSDWSTEAMGAMVQAGLLKGTSPTTLSPKDPCTIEQSIVLIYRVYRDCVPET